MAPKGELFHIFKGLLCLCYFLPWILVQDIYFQTSLLATNYSTFLGQVKYQYTCI